MAKLRVACLNRGRDAFPGGDLTHIDALTDALRPLGVERTYEPSQTLTGAFDLFHVHHISLSWCRMNFEACARFPHIPIVATCIYYPTEGLGVPFAEQRSWLERTAAVVTYTLREQREVRMLTGFAGAVDVVPPGVDTALFSADSTIDVDARKGVLTVAARAGDKNCDRVQRACEALNLPFSQAIGLSREELARAYRRAKVFVNASGHESFGLTILEALASGCRVVVNEHLWALEHFPGVATFIPSDDDVDLMDGIADAYDAADWDWEPNGRARTMTWALEAERMKTLYERVLSQFKRRK